MRQKVPVKDCIVCRKAFDADPPQRKTCGDYCAKERRKQKQQEHRQLPEIKARIARCRKEYNSIPRVKEKRRQQDRERDKAHPEKAKERRQKYANRIANLKRMAKELGVKW